MKDLSIQKGSLVEVRDDTPYNGCRMFVYSINSGMCTLYPSKDFSLLDVMKAAYFDAYKLMVHEFKIEELVLCQP